MWETFTIQLTSCFFKTKCIFNEKFLQLRIEDRMKFSEKCKPSFNSSLQVVSALYNYYLDNK